MPNLKLFVWSVSLGCPKNRVDTERVLGSLGLELEMVEEIERAELLFINTCGFIEPAVRESVRTVLETIEEKKQCGSQALLVVAGCLVGRYGSKILREELPEVDLWLTSADIALWPSILCQTLAKGSACRGRLLSTPPSYAWLKIGEGCKHHCSFCTIPDIRGALKSESLEDIYLEAKDLVARGVKELILVAQDVGAWGQDQGNTLQNLLIRLSTLEELVWLRCLYLYPTGLTDDFLSYMRSAKRPLLPYFDIPLQHCVGHILRSMGRPFAQDPRFLLEKIHHYLPDAVLRTTFIVGFPGETDEDFALLCRFVEEGHFLHVGVFAYQQEEGSKAAELPGQLPMSVREERRNRLLEIQRDVSHTILETYHGQKMTVLVDSANIEWPGLYNGRVWFQAPEVDGQTYVSGEGVGVGRVVEGEVVENSDY
ncbi:MAG: 30S ribosomal protein S12 methylthiotransferase RimO, partial [Desulfovibrio sp.]|nr:30S ribosomal protein S12 methylthiotransferase RimO [Desulfovibrio sp.]